MLRRDGLISAWYDRDIKAGGVIDDEVSAQLERCDLFLALVSPDFLNSSYCYEREMTRAIERHEAGEMRIVPIIVEPCDWRSSPLERFKVLPRDGRPITEWTNQNNAFVDVVTELRRLAEGETQDIATEVNVTTSGREPRKYRVKRKFDELDKADFRKAAFNTIKKYFEASIRELDAIEGIKARFETIDATSFTCMVLNRKYREEAACITVHAGSGRNALGDVYYSFEDHAPVNTANGSFSVEADDYDLYLKDSGFGFRQETINKLSPEQAAELLWIDFLEHTGISHA